MGLGMVPWNAGQNSIHFARGPAHGSMEGEGGKAEADDAVAMDTNSGNKYNMFCINIENPLKSRFTVEDPGTQNRHTVAAQSVATVSGFVILPKARTQSHLGSYLPT